jgi:branched-subunit amino acid aminotransferase/4-amino-4-deoxychorismate lyase
MDVWINGQFISAEDAQISVFDAGFQHGVGLFETMRAEHGRPFRATAHVERLAESARILRLTERLHVEPLVEAIEQVIQHNKMDQARVRLTVTGGNLNMLQSQGTSPQDPTVLIVTQPPTPYLMLPAVASATSSLSPTMNSSLHQRETKRKPRCFPASPAPRSLNSRRS